MAYRRRKQRLKDLNWSAMNSCFNGSEGPRTLVSSLSPSQQPRSSQALGAVTSDSRSSQPSAGLGVFM